MKERNHRIRLLSVPFVALVAFLALSSCQKDQKYLFSFVKGTPVSFGVTTSGSALTRTSYSGEKYSGDKYERIDWQAGDRIRIYCAAVSEPSCKYADYRVLENSVHDNDTEKSYAKIIQSSPDDMGLRWGEGEHTFYAVTPSTGIGKNDEHVKASASVSPIQYPVLALTEDEETVTIPAGETQTLGADMRYMFMAAKSGTYTEETGIPEGENVFLSFTPLTTAIEFTITNGTAAPMTLTSVSLISGNDKSTAPVINGDFTIDLDSWETPADAKPTDESMTVTYTRDYPACIGDATSSYIATRTIKIPFDKEITLAAKDGDTKGGSLTFTFLLTPTHDFEDLTFKFTKKIAPEGKEGWMSTRLGYTDGSGIFFPRFKKSYIEGLMLPEGAQWTVNYGPASSDDSDAATVVTNWNTGIEKELNLGGGEPVTWVNLGLPSGILWADRNLGSKNEADPGDHFAWGETSAYGEAPSPYPSGWSGTKNDDYLKLETKTAYNNGNYKYKFGYPSDTHQLYPVDDPVYARLGLLSASTPTDVQWREMLANCNSKVETTGVRFTSNLNGNSIFIPFNGFYYDESGEIPDEKGMKRKDMGHYWTSTIYGTGQAWRFGLFNTGTNIGEYLFAAAMGIRPVKVNTDNPVAVDFIDLGLPSGTMWADVNLGATAKTGIGSLGKYYSYGETNAYHEAPAPYPSDYEGTRNQKYLDLPYKSVYLDFNYYKWNNTGKYTSGVLEPEDDAATVALGIGYSTPTTSEWEELLNNCKVTEETVEGVKGRRFTSKIIGYTDKSIFLPYSGLIGGYAQGFDLYNAEGDYWVANAVSETQSYRFRVNNTAAELIDDMVKTYGISVRAVKHVHKSVKIGNVWWATCNVGANTPKDYGWYFNWGGTEGYVINAGNNNWLKSSDHTSVLSGGFCWANTPYQTQSNNPGDGETKFNKYLGSTSSTYKDDTATDEDAQKSVLDPEDDAAHVNWGGSWRMPTSAEFKAMKDATYWAWDTTDKGYYVFAPNTNHKAGSINNSIPSDLNKASALLFFPAAGYGHDIHRHMLEGQGYYWSSSLNLSDPYKALDLKFDNESVNPQESSYGRKIGHSVRPVHD